MGRPPVRPGDAQADRFIYPENRPVAGTHLMSPSESISTAAALITTRFCVAQRAATGPHPTRAWRRSIRSSRPSTSDSPCAFRSPLCTRPTGTTTHQPPFCRMRWSIDTDLGGEQLVDQREGDDRRWLAREPGVDRAKRGSVRPWPVCRCAGCHSHRHRGLPGPQATRPLHGRHNPHTHTHNVCLAIWWLTRCHPAHARDRADLPGLHRATGLAIRGCGIAV